MPSNPEEKPQRLRQEVRRTRIPYSVTVLIKLVLLFLVGAFQQ